MPVTTKKDIAKSIKTLLVLLQSMRGQQVVLTLRNDSIVRGTVVKVDSNMNINMSDVTIEPDPFYIVEDRCEDVDSVNVKSDYMVVKGTRIRHIEVPRDFNLIEEGKREINRVRNRRKQWTKNDII
jgi:small nuclear ribonucleoprotein (snRNP)-like protein